MRRCDTEEVYLYPKLVKGKKGKRKSDMEETKSLPKARKK